MMRARAEHSNVRRNRLAMSIVLVACAGASQATAAPPDVEPATAAAADRRAIPARQANPFTGTDLALERKQVELERARLDEQIAASELNRRKYQFEMMRLGSSIDTGVAGLPANAVPAANAFDGAVYRGAAMGVSTVVEPRLLQDVVVRPNNSAPGTPTTANRGAAASAGAVAATAGRENARRKLPAMAPKPATPAVELLAVVTDKAGQRALVASAGRIVRVARGDLAFGRRVDAIDARSVSLDGQVYAMREQPATLGRVDSHPDRGTPSVRATQPAYARDTYIDLNQGRNEDFRAGGEPPIPVPVR